MTSGGLISGFSGFSREDKIKLAASFTGNPELFIRELRDHWHHDHLRQKQYESLTENVVSNFFLPYSLVPNFKINGKDYIVPMVTEESSVVTACASAAKFWWPLGGFYTRIEEMEKPGHIHFIWKGGPREISEFFTWIEPGLFDAVKPVTGKMSKRGGGVSRIQLNDCSATLPGYYQVEVSFQTADAMGANFINTCLEIMAGYILQQADQKGLSDRLEIIMSVLSNFTQHCKVKCSVSCRIHELSKLHSGADGLAFARKFETSVMIARHSLHRAVTNNKGIYNGIDGVLIATGNDFRAAEAAGHAWAAKDGVYRGLTEVELDGNYFTCGIEIPLSVGVVGGLTSLHPMARISLMLLNNPDAAGLMAVVAAAGLANNFSAIRALITGGIQKGHMQLHLANLLSQLGATDREKERAIEYFKQKTVTHTGVEEFIDRIRKENPED